ncbi:succinate dehydrogenase cytochrome b subunit [Planctellipticum variicoloris]|uniref:succinate dehydrogenase cytochrome b subunit n=1 Tax=Planctellipticum variicoloris TaxID=3064265 RepID=UPI0030139943|nr:succinate dehydrogenase cytochrome b subunit [Planctomycetaceae bacterium SH412]
MGTATAEPKGSLLEKLNLLWAHRLITSSIGRKFVMGVTGLLLCGFLVGHLAGNLLLFSGQHEFDKYAAWIHNNELTPLAEAGLLVLFLAHIYLAFVTTLENREARKIAYARKESKIPERSLAFPPSNWMFLSGSIVLLFVLLHLADLRMGVRPDIAYPQWNEEAPPMYVMTVRVLSNPVSRVIYILGTVFLGFHLSHGFSSAFQSLGLSHPKYTPLIKAIGILFAVVIGAGFAALPVLVPELAPREKVVAPAEPHP